jgi:hypothetical protein
MNKIGLVFLLIGVWSHGLSQELITEKYLKFLEQNPIESAYLQLPNKVHFTGDSLYIAGLMSDLLFRPTNEISQIVKVSLLNEDKTTQLTSFFKNNNGSFTGKIHLPHSLLSGSYFVIAHTSYMGNFDQALLDIKPIYVKNLWDEFQLSPNYELPVKINKTLNYHSELGSIIPGINQRILIQAPDDLSPQAEYAALSSSQGEIKRISLKNGIGSLYLQPEADKKYELKIFSKTGDLLKSRGIVSADNFAIKTAKVGPNLIISILKPETEIEDQFSLILESGQQLQSIIDIAFKENSITTFVIPAKSLNGNFHSLVLVDKALNVLANNTFFLKTKSSLTIQKDDSVLVGSKNKILIKAEDEVNLTVSLIKDGGTNLANKLALLYTQSEISNLLTTAYQMMPVEDLLVSLNEDHKRKWQNILSSGASTNEISIRPEIGIDIRGHIANESLNGFYANFYQTKDKISYQVKIDKNGEFYLPLADFEDKETLIFTVSDSLGRVYENEVIFTKDSLSLDDFSIFPYTGDSSLIEQMTLKRIAAQYLIDNTNRTTVLFDRIPYDKLYKMDDFVILNTVEEVVEDIITLASLKKIKGKKTIRIDIPSAGLSYYAPPTLIVDDKLIDFSSFWSIPPLYIHEIKISYEPITVDIFGNVGSLGGIIALSLKKNTPQSVMNKLIDKKIKIIGYAGKTSDPIPEGYPDFKSTLLNVACSSKYDHLIKYQTSNLAGSYKLIIEGLNENGELIKFIDTIENIAD